MDQKRDHDEDDDRKLTIHHKRHDQGTEEHSGRSKRHTKPHHQDILNLLDIVREPRNERTGAVVVDILKGELLDLPEEVVSHVTGKGDGRLRGK